MDLSESERVGTAIGDSSDESCCRIFEWLQQGKNEVGHVQRRRKESCTNCVLLLAGDGTRSGEHETEHGELALLLLDETLEGVDMERNGISIDGENDRTLPRIDHDLSQMLD